MNRRDFMVSAGLAGTAVVFAGTAWGRAAYRRRQLANQLTGDAMSELVQKGHAELRELPARARDEIRAWFHAPCLNSAEFVLEICSPSFAEKLSACPTADLKEACFVNAFVNKVVSAEEILTRVGVIAEEIGSELDRNWAHCCKQISAKWDLHIKPTGSTMPTDFRNRIEPLVQNSVSEAIRQSRGAGQKSAIGDTLTSIGKSALLVMPMVAFPEYAIPLFALFAIRDLYSYAMGRLNNRVGDYQAAISGRIAALGIRIGSEFQTEIKSRIGALQSWQEGALRSAAEVQAEQAISII